MSANAGLGAMTAFEGIVHLVDHLRPALSPEPGQTKSTPTEEECNQIFAAYKRDHMPRAKMLVDTSKSCIRFEARANWFYSLLATYIMPMFSNIGRQFLAGRLFTGSPTFSHLPVDMTKPINCTNSSLKSRRSASNEARS